jgi:hypothetical protein
MESKFEIVYSDYFLAVYENGTIVWVWYFEDNTDPDSVAHVMSLLTAGQGVKWTESEKRRAPENLSSQ